MLVIGVALAALSFVAVLAIGGFGQQAPPPPQIPDVPVVVAASDLTLGMQVTADKLATTTKPQTDAVGTYQDPNEVVGKVVRRAVVSGTALTTADFETEVSVPELVKALQPGLRAIAVPLSKVDSVGALLQAGDFVDVLISMEDGDGLNPIVVANPAASPGTTGPAQDPYTDLSEYMNKTTVKVVVQNVQVLAAIAAAPTEPTNVVSGDASATPEPDMVVLLAVTPQQLEVVRFAQLDGNISLALRSPADSGAAAVDTTGITLKQLVDQYGVLTPGAVSPPVAP
jgi:pilus assembly protein CpaB